ncbi:YitT family protein [Microbacterium betulae]|uniref:YitT family protein n=1 Tax=Microbacterium betulae TaxID=2981139 RepID=A0AA97FF19_9MICO|nr:YitT family protein [Microbacterium sp. AB]WOF22451.1 YitT family protein [Microbacterium sp. AB]
MSRTPTERRSLVFDWDETAHTVPEDVLGLLTGTFVAALGLSLLKAGGAVTGGTAGLALLLSHATESIPFSALFLIVNLPFAALAIWKKGWRFALLTAVCIAAVSGFSELDAALLPFGALNAVYAVLGGNLLAGVGVLILFRHGASIGGINIIALLVQEKTGFRAGWTQMAFDLAIVALSLTVMPWPIVVLSATGAVLLNIVLALNHRPGRYIGH